MEIHQIIERFRRDIDDVPDISDGPDFEDLMIPDQDVFAFLNEAQERFAELTQLLTDSITRAVCETRVVPNQPYVQLDPRLIYINYAYLVSSNRPLAIQPFNQAVSTVRGDDYGNQIGGGHWIESKGVPAIFIPDIQNDCARLIPCPTEADAIKMFVIRYPLEEIEQGSDERALEVRKASYQRVLLDFMKARAYGRQDVDIFDLDLESIYDAKFIAQCADIKAEKRRLRHKHAPTVYGGIPIGGHGPGHGHGHRHGH